MPHITPRQAREEFGIHREQLLTWERDGQLDGAVTRTGGGHRRFDRDRLQSLSQDTVESKGITPYIEMGSTGLRRWGGTVFEERLRELQGRAGRILYREMRLNDPVISAIFFALVNVMRQADWRVKPFSEEEPDIEAAEFIETCLGDMSWSWQDQLSFIFDPMFEQGFSALEVVYKKRLGINPPNYTDNPAMSRYIDGRIGWRKWSPRPAESLAPGNEWIFDANGGILGINQQPETETSDKQYPVAIPIQKMLLYRTTVHPSNTPEGVPIHRAMYLPWWYSNQLMEIEGIGIERNVAGIPVVYLGSDCTLKGENSDYDVAKDLVTNIRIDEQTGVVIPKAKMGDGAAEGQGMRLELLSTPGTTDTDIGGVIERYDKRKAVSVLAQFILLGMDGVGSFALSKNQSDLFILASKAWLLSVADIINRHAITRLMQLNVFPGITGMPSLVPGVLGIPDLKEMSDYVNKLVGIEVLTPDAELERHLRQVGGLPAPLLAVDSPEEPIAEEGDAEKTASLLRRISLAIDPLKKLNIITDEDAAEMLTPLVEEFKAILAKQENVGIKFENRLEENIDIAWGEMQDEIEAIGENDPDRDELIAAALSLLILKVEEAVKDAYIGVWKETRGDGFDPIELPEIEAAAVRAMVLFTSFMEQFQTDLFGIPIEDIPEKIKNRKSRALMYSGGAWALFNLAKIWDRPQSEIWTWDGPVDGNSCACCIEEMSLGARPLSQIHRMPGGCDCLSRCRHELKQVR